MKYAFMEGQRHEAQTGMSGICPVCGNPMVARCGEVRVHHWAHKVGKACDHWWENETAWHRSWKNEFPKEWQEYVQIAENGEKHIADVKTDQGWVLEFQHSYMKPEEHRSRENFYGQMIWVVDGARRKNDRKQFFKALELHGRHVTGQVWTCEKSQIQRYALFRDWSDSPVPVFFDFAGGNEEEDSRLWCFLNFIEGKALVGSFPREVFLDYHKPDTKMVPDFAGLLQNLHERVKEIVEARSVRPTDPRSALQHRAELLRRQQQGQQKKEQ